MLTGGRRVGREKEKMVGKEGEMDEWGRTEWLGRLINRWDNRFKGEMDGRVDSGERDEEGKGGRRDGGERDDRINDA